MDGTNRLELCKTYVRLLLLTILRNQNSVKSEVDSDTLAFPITIARGVFRIHFSFSNILIKGIRLRHWWALGQISRRFRSEEHTSELQSLMRISYAVFRLKKKTEQ